MDRLLYIGCAPGSDVAMLQADLNAVRNHVGQGSAYEILTTDGIFGAKTCNRVSEFQRINRLTADGIAGPQTKATIQELLNSQPGLQIQQAGGGAGATQGTEVGKPVPAFKGGQNFGKMPPCDGSSGQAAKGGSAGVGGQAKSGGYNQPPYGARGKVPFGGKFT
jgi:peptidoglycan hydrolase-like protein with peptidoglycan-binding domain